MAHRAAASAADLRALPTHPRIARRAQDSVDPPPRLRAAALVVAPVLVALLPLRNSADRCASRSRRAAAHRATEVGPPVARLAHRPTTAEIRRSRCPSARR